MTIIRTAPIAQLPKLSPSKPKLPPRSFRPPQSSEKIGSTILIRGNLLAENLRQPRLWRNEESGDDQTPPSNNLVPHSGAPNPPGPKALAKVAVKIRNADLVLKTDLGLSLSFGALAIAHLSQGLALTFSTPEIAWFALACVRICHVAVSNLLEIPQRGLLNSYFRRHGGRLFLLSHHEVERSFIRNRERFAAAQARINSPGRGDVHFRQAPNDAKQAENELRLIKAEEDAPLQWFIDIQKHLPALLPDSETWPRVWTLLSNIVLNLREDYSSRRRAIHLFVDILQQFDQAGNLPKPLAEAALEFFTEEAMEELYAQFPQLLRDHLGLMRKFAREISPEHPAATSIREIYRI